MNIKGKIVLVTGASSGIGEAMAIECARNGAHVVLLARRLDRLKKTAEEIEKLACHALPIQCDVTQREHLDRAVAAAVKKFGRIDIVIGNAGFGVVGNAEKLSIEDYRRQFETNVFGLIETFHSTLSELKKSKGIFAAMGSVTSYISLPHASAYAMSKFAVRAFCESVGPELRKDGVSVVLMNPGFVESDIRRTNNHGVVLEGAPDGIPAYLIMSRFRAAKQLVRAIAARRREINITAVGKLATLFVRHFPGLFHFLIARGISGRSEPLTSPPKS